MNDIIHFVTNLPTCPRINFNTEKPVSQSETLKLVQELELDNGNNCPENEGW